MPRRPCEYCEPYGLGSSDHEGTHRVATIKLGRFVWACDKAFEHFREPSMTVKSRIVVPGAVQQ